MLSLGPAQLAVQALDDGFTASVLDLDKIQFQESELHINKRTELLVSVLI